jgi:enoyl-CoA hydratase/carnithine racemase
MIMETSPAPQDRGVPAADVPPADVPTADLPVTDVPARYPSCGQLQLGWCGGVLSVGLNRPRKRNAIGVEMTLEIERTLLAAQSDAELRVIVLHGVGEHFSAGMDMKDFFDHTDRDPDALRRARAATDNWRARVLRRLPQTVIAAVRGYCLGGALPLLECADIVLASGDAVFGLPEINFGFVPGGPIAKSLRGAVTVRAASYAALSGRPFDACQARKWGLVTHVVEHGDPYDEALALAHRVARAAHDIQLQRTESR